MQESFIKISNEWTLLSDEITIDSDKYYFIQNRGADVLVALESDSLPDEGSEDGVMILPYTQAIYKKDTQNLYLRAFNNNCLVNITSAESANA